MSSVSEFVGLKKKVFYLDMALFKYPGILIFLLKEEWDAAYNELVLEPKMYFKIIWKNLKNEMKSLYDNRSRFLQDVDHRKNFRSVCISLAACACYYNKNPDVLQDVHTLTNKDVLIMSQSPDLFLS
jgi:hypothetical protein